MKYLEAIQHKSPRKSKAYMVAKKVRRLERRLFNRGPNGLGFSKLDSCYSAMGENAAI